MDGQPPSRSGWLRRTLRRSLVLFAGLLFLLVLTLLTVGLPLGPVMRRVFARIEATQPQTRWESDGGRLRLEWTGAWRVDLAGCRVLRAADQSPVASVQGATLHLPFTRWVRLYLAPDDVRVRVPVLQARQLSTGAWEFWPAGPQTAAPPAGPAFRLRDLPPMALPRPGRAMRVSVEDAAVRLLVQGDKPRTLAWSRITLDLSSAGGADLRAAFNAEPVVGSLAPAGAGTVTAEIPTDALSGTASGRVADLGAWLPLAPSSSGFKSLAGAAEFRLEAATTLGDLTRGQAKLHLGLTNFTVAGVALPSRLVLPAAAFDAEVQSADLTKVRIGLTAEADGRTAEVEAETTVDRPKHSARFDCALRGLRLEQIRAWLPDLSLPEAQSPLTATLGGFVSWSGATVRVSEVCGHFAAGPGELHAAPASPAIALPAVTADLRAGGDFGRVLSGRLDLRGGMEGGPGSPAFELTTVLAETGGRWEGTFNLAETNLATVEPWLKALALPVAVTGQFAVDARASGVTQPFALDTAALTTRARSFTVTAPQWLARPLTLAPFTLAVQVQDGGRTGRIEPFVLAAGPVLAECTGGKWETPEGVFRGGATVTLGRLAWAEVAPWLAPALRTRLALPEASLAEWALAGLSVETRVSGLVGQDGIPQPERLEADVDTHLAVNGEPLAIRAGAQLDWPTGVLRATVDVPDFVEARWKLAVLEKLPVPLIEAPARAQFATEITLPLSGRPGRVVSATWHLEADAGRLVPQGPLLRWLVGPLPLRKFVAGGRIVDHFRQLTLDEADLQLGRARLRFERGIVTAPATVFAAGVVPLEIRMHWLLEDWYAEDLLPLVSAEVRGMLPAELPPGRNGLRRLEADFAARASLHPDSTLEIASAEATQSAQLTLGGRDVPVEMRTGFDPASRTLRTSVHLPPLNPASLGLPPPPYLPFGLGDFDLPVEFRAEALVQLPERIPGEFAPPRFTAELSAGPGTLRRSGWLGADTPVESFRLVAGMQLNPVTLDRLELMADFRGPRLTVRDATVGYGETLTAAAEVEVAHVPLGWLLERAPRPMLPPNLAEPLRRLGLSGDLEKVRLMARASADPRQLDQPPQLAKLELDATLTGAAASWDGQPAARIAKIHLTGDPAGLRLTLDDFAAGPARVPRAEVTLTEPFAAKRALCATADWSADLARLSGYLSQLQIPVTWPAGLDPAKLAGRLEGAVRVSGPMRQPFVLGDWTADMTVRGEGLVPPAVGAGAEVGPVSLTLTAAVKSGQFDGAVDLVPASLVVAPYLSGAVPVKIRARGDAGLQASETTIALDLTAAKLALGPVAWQKPAGAPARVEVRVKTAGLLAADRSPHGEFELKAEGLPLGAWSGTGDVDFRAGYAGKYGGWRRAELREARLGHSVVRARAEANDEGALQLAVESPSIDGGELARFCEKFIGDYNAWISGPFVEEPPPVLPPAVNPGLPDLHGTLRVDRIEMGPQEAFTAVTGTFGTRGGWPAAADLKWRCGPQDYSIDWTGAPAGDNLTARFTDVGRLFAAVTAPLGTLSIAAIPPDSILAMVRDIPFKIRDGDLQYQGRYELQNPGEYVTGRLRVDGLMLEKQIGFLDKVAGLVKKKPILRVPFRELTAEKVAYGALGFTAKKIFLAGPVDVAADTATWTPWNSKLLVHGKVFGVCFEVSGAPAGTAGFYLCDDSQVVRAFTTQDDWDFDQTPEKKPEKKDDKAKAKK